MKKEVKTFYTENIENEAFISFINDQLILGFIISSDIEKCIESNNYHIVKTVYNPLTKTIKCKVIICSDCFNVCIDNQLKLK